MNQNNLFEKGSEWRKWDLHLHTPETKLNDQFNKNWEEYLKKISDSDIDVFGITDYFSFDTFLKLHEKIESKKGTELFDKIKNKVFIPNIELRLLQQNKNNQNINLHILFNPNMKDRDSQLKNFLSKLKLNETDGKFCDTNVNYKKDYTRIEDIKEAIKNSKINNEDYLIITPINGYGSTRNSKDEEDRINEILKPIKNFCHLFFGNKSNNKFTKDNYKKPSILCSDAHKLTDINIYDETNSKGFTWIKADPTFDGLKQILYEPDDRVKIQENKPDKKEKYNIIDSIQIKNKDENNKIVDYKSDDGLEIKFNQNLNSIIGEKSSGKFFLLHLLARTLLDRQTFDDLSNIFDNKNDENNKFIEKYNNLLKQIECTIEYKNNTYFQLDIESFNDRKIRYIPQGYLNQSVRDQISIETIKQDIIKILKTKDKKLKEKENEYNNFLENNQQEINKNINIYFSTEEKIQTLEKERIDYGITIDEIKKQQQEKETELNYLMSKFNNNVEDIKLYQQYEKNIKELEKEKNINNNLLNNLNNIKFETLKYHFESFKKNIKDRMDNDILCNCLDEIYLNSETTFNKYKQKQEYIIKIKILKEETNILKEENKIKFIKTKIEKQKDLNIKKNNIENEILKIYNKKSELEQIDDDIKKQKNIQKLSRNKIITNFNEFYIKITEYCTEFNEILNKIKDKIDGINNLQFKPSFQLKLYKSKFEDIFDMRGGNITNNLYEYNEIDSLKKYQKHFLKLFHSTKKLKYKNNKSQKDILYCFCINFLKPTLFIEYDNNIFDETMSAGKRAILLLKILIEFDEENTPILIDQPEDDLDGKSVYKYLVNYIKEAKKRRQIILVSHNPNIVVGSDSEEVIIAQQKNKKFFYKSGSLENSYIKNDQITPDTAGIRENVCDILEGGTIAFKKREEKYNINNLK